MPREAASILVTSGLQERKPEADGGGRFLQSGFWADFKSRHGWENFNLLVHIACGEKSYDTSCSVLIRRFRAGAIAYVPMGLDISDKNGEPLFPVSEYALVLERFAENVIALLPFPIFCVRFDLPADCPTIEERNAYVSALCGCGRLRRAPVSVQPPDTVILSLQKTEEELLNAMKPKWRYNIRLAERKGVSVRKGAAADIDIFYSLYEITARRDGIAVHAKSYYRDLILGAGDSPGGPLVSLYIAEYEDEPLAAIITIFCKKEAVYLYGASSDSNRNVMPAYLLQWRAIRDAKAFGSCYYDFYGIPPNEDISHPMHGLYRFKTGFGGQVIHRPGCFDVPASGLYWPYACAEKMRAVWFKRIKKAFKRKRP